MNNASALPAETPSTAKKHPSLVHIGTSGWNYPEWRGKFYPPGLVQAQELSFISNVFDTLEINSSFYRLMLPKTFEKWERSVPDGFEFAVKGWKNITHMRRLRNCADDLAVFFSSGVMALAATMGPILWQLPPSLTFDADVLEVFLGTLPRTYGEAQEMGRNAPPPAVKDRDKPGAQPALIDLSSPTCPGLSEKPLRYALEPRSAGFGTDQALEILKENNVALVMADTAGRYPQFDEVTADFVYIRLHGSPRMYFSNYSEATLSNWAEKIRTWRASGLSTWCYFDNTGAGHAPYNAQSLAKMVAA